MVRRWAGVIALCLAAALPLSAQIRQGGLVKADGSEATTGTVTTTSTLVSGRVALSSGAASLTDDAGCTWTGTGNTFHLKLGTAADAGLAWVAPGTLRLSDGSTGYGDLQLGALKARTAGSFRFIADGPNNTVSLASDAKFQFSSTTGAQGTPDLALSRVSAGLFLVEDGSGNARDVQARTGTFGTSLVAPKFVSGPGKSGTNVAGTNNTIQAEPGTGSATGSSIIFQTPTATTSGTTAQTQTTRITINETGADVTGNVVASGYVLAASNSVVGFNGGPKWISSTGSPEGVIAAVVGSLYSRTDGGAGTTLYIKESGIGNTGWVAK